MIRIFPSVKIQAFVYGVFAIYCAICFDKSLPGSKSVSCDPAINMGTNEFFGGYILLVLLSIVALMSSICSILWCLSGTLFYGVMVCVLLRMAEKFMSYDTPLTWDYILGL